MGNPGRNRQKGPRYGNRDPNRSGGGGGGGRHGNVGGPMHDEPVDHAPFIETGEDAEIISPEELAASRKSMNLTTLKAMPINKLVDLAAKYGVENMARSRKQDIIFSLLKAHARQGEPIYGEGVLEILQDGFGFLRSADGSYLAGPDDI